MISKCQNTRFKKKKRRKKNLHIKSKVIENYIIINHWISLNCVSFCLCGITVAVAQCVTVQTVYITWIMHCVLFLLGPYYLCNLFGTQRYTSSCLVTAAETGSAHTSTTEWAPLIYATNLYVLLYFVYIYIFICERDCDCSCAMSTEARSNWIWLMWLSMMEQRWWDTLATHLHWRCPAICIFFCCCCCCCPSSLVILIVLLYYAAKWACFVINQVPVCGGFAISESGQWSTHTHTLGLRVAAEMNEWMNECCVPLCRVRTKLYRNGHCPRTHHITSPNKRWQFYLQYFCLFVFQCMLLAEVLHCTQQTR